MIFELKGIPSSQKLCKKLFRVGANRLLQVGMKLFQFSLIDIDRGLVRATGEVLRGIASDRKIQANPDSKKKI